MGKRGRSLIDIAGSIDDLVACGRVCEIYSSSSVRCNSDDGDSQDTSRGTNRSAAARVRISPEVSTDHTESQKSVGSVFATELSFFCREEEDDADMSLYLMQTVSSARTPDAFIALVNHFLKIGPETVMLSLKRAGLQSQFFSLFCTSSTQSIAAEQQRLFLRLIAFLVPLSDAAAVCNVALVKYLLLNCQSPQECAEGEKSVVSAEASPSKRSAHWSQRKCRTVALPTRQQQQQPFFLQAIEVMDKLCGVEDDISAISIALRTLLNIVFSQNGSLAVPGETNVCLAFADQGGFDVVSRLFYGWECADSLHLLEAVTLCEGLRRIHVVELQKTAICLVNFITDETWRKGPCEMNAALRVLTNVTGLTPHVLSGPMKECPALAAAAAKTLTDAEVATDTLAFMLCLATNIVKWEIRENRTEFTSCLVECPSFLPRTASLTLSAYHADEREKNVVAGYYALFLAVLSLCSAPGLKLRVPVMTAVARAAEGTELGRKVEAKPLTLIAAILQEFLLFQSSAGSLTKEALISMNEIIDNVVKCNGIEITSDG